MPGCARPGPRARTTGPWPRRPRPLRRGRSPARCWRPGRPPAGPGRGRPGGVEVGLDPLEAGAGAGDQPGSRPGGPDLGGRLAAEDVDAQPARGVQVGTGPLGPEGPGQPVGRGRRIRATGARARGAATAAGATSRAATASSRPRTSSRMWPPGRERRDGDIAPPPGVPSGRGSDTGRGTRAVPVGDRGPKTGPDGTTRHKTYFLENAYKAIETRCQDRRRVPAAAQARATSGMEPSPAVASRLRSSSRKAARRDSSSDMA